MKGKQKRDESTIGGTEDKPTAEDYALLLAQERLVMEAQVAIQRLLRRANKSQAELAQLLGVSEARVCQMFSASARNLTLRNLARAFHVLGTRCRLVDEAEVVGTARAASRGEIVNDGTDHEAAAPGSMVGDAQTRTDRSHADEDSHWGGVFDADTWLLGGRDSAFDPTYPSRGILTICPVKISSESSIVSRFASSMRGQRSASP